MTQTNSVIPKTNTNTESSASELNTLVRLSRMIKTRLPSEGGDPETSYVARLLAKGADAILKKVGEEATEVVLAAKDLSHAGQSQPLVNEMADLWFHCLIALVHYGLTPEQVFAELERRVGLSGLEEKALRKVRERERTGE
jgi:phosphoribosyl-ATP pyrophosphohydrolase